MSVYKKIIMYIIIGLTIFCAGGASSYLIGRNDYNTTIAEYESRNKLLKESEARKIKIISDIRITVTQLEEGLRIREEITRRRDQQIHSLESTIQRLISGDGSEQDSLNRLEQLYIEISKRISPDPKEE